MTPEGWKPGVDPAHTRLRLVRRLRRPRRQHVGAAGGRRTRERRDPRPAARSRSWPSATAASCTSTATACSRRSTRPRTPCRRRCCARGAAARTFAGGPLFRAWLYRIATNVCLDTLRRSSRRADRACTRSPRCRGCSRTRTSCWTRSRRASEEPEAVVVERETISLAFLAALQLLPPRQRAALIARDVLGWPAEETATMLETSVAAANSALQRARATLQGAPARAARRVDGRASRAPRSATCSRGSSTRTSAATREAAIAIAAQRHPRDDAAVPDVLRRPRRDRAAARARVRPRPRRRLAPPADARQPHARRRELPAPARATRSSAPFKLDVLRVEDGAIAEITTFGPAPFPALGLPATLD